MRFVRYSRWEEPLGDLHGVLKAEREISTDGTDNLTVKLAEEELERDERILIEDPVYGWVEYLVTGGDTKRSNTRPITEYKMVNAIAELGRVGIVEKRNRGEGPAHVFMRAIEDTRWELGSIEVGSIPRVNISFYHCTVLEALEDAANAFGLELYASYSVDRQNVVHRYINAVNRRGGDTNRRFTFGKDLTSVRRTIVGSVYTRLYGYGKGVQGEANEETGDVGYGRKLSFADINNGKPYVEDNAARLIWGLPGPNGQKIHSDLFVDYPDIEDPVELMAATMADLKKAVVPQFNYSADVLMLSRGGFDYEGVSIGDTVAIIDTTFNPPLRLAGRVLVLKENLLGNAADCKCTLGNIILSLTAKQKVESQKVSDMWGNASAWDDAASLKTSYVDGVINGLNTVINATGGYVYMEPGEGIIVYDKPKDENPTKAIQLGGGSFRIANSKAANGEWNWRTFGTGDGFVADLLIAGRIRGGSNFWDLETGELFFDQGKISSSDGKNFWNLGTGEFKLSGDGTNKVEINAEVIKIGSESLPDKVGTLVTKSELTQTSNSLEAAITSSRAHYGYCTTGASTQVKQVTCTNFDLYTGAMISVRFSYGNTAESPTMSVNGSAAKPIYIYGSTLSGDNKKYSWNAGDVVTFVYSGSYWYVSDAGALSRIKVTEDSILLSVSESYPTKDYVSSTYTTKSDFEVAKDSITSSITSLQSCYGVCQTAGGVQVKIVECPGFTLYKGAVISVYFRYGNTWKSTVSGTGVKINVNGTGDRFILMNNTYMMADSNYNIDSDKSVVTFVYDGAYFRVQDGWANSKIEQKIDSISLSVTGSLGSTASISLTVDGATSKKDLDLSDVRKKWANDTSAVTVSAGMVTFNSNTFVCNSTNFKVTSNGIVTATSAQLSGSFTCGSSSGSKIYLSSGQMIGYYNNRQYGYIDFTGESYDVNNPSTVYHGIQIQASQILRISSPRLSVSGSSNVGTTTTSGYTGSVGIVHSITDLGGGSIQWSYGTLRFITGILVGA